MTFLQPSLIPGETKNLPSSATVWGMLQLPGLLASGSAAPSMSLGTFQEPQIGVNSSLSALGDKFNGLGTEGYLDFNKHVGLDYSMNVSGWGMLSGEVELEGVTPDVPPFQAPLTVSQKLSLQRANRTSSAQHLTKLSMPVFGKAGVAKVHYRPHPDGAAVALEFSEKVRKGSTGSPRQPPPGQSPIDPGTDAEDDTSVRRTSRLPSLKLELQPGSVPLLSRAPCRGSGNGGVCLRWSQAWSSVLRTNASYRSSKKRAEADVRAVVRPSVQLLGGVRVAANEEDERFGLQQAAAKIIWKARRAPSGRNMVQLEARYAAGVGVTHVIKLRHKASGGRGGAEGDLSLQFRPKRSSPELQFDVFLPI